MAGISRSPSSRRAGAGCGNQGMTWPKRTGVNYPSRGGGVGGRCGSIGNNSAGSSIGSIRDNRSWRTGTQSDNVSVHSFPNLLHSGIGTFGVDSVRCSFSRDASIALHKQHLCAPSNVFRAPSTTPSSLAYRTIIPLHATTCITPRCPPHNCRHTTKADTSWMKRFRLTSCTPPPSERKRFRELGAEMKEKCKARGGEHPHKAQKLGHPLRSGHVQARRERLSGPAGRFFLATGLHGSEGEGGGLRVDGGVWGESIKWQMRKTWVTCTQVRWVHT